MFIIIVFYYITDFNIIINSMLNSIRPTLISVFILALLLLFYSGQFNGTYAQSPGTVPMKISSLSGNFNGQLDNSDLFGVSSTNIGDLDGDGVKDIAVGASSDDDGGTDRGALWILFLNADGTVKSHQKISSVEGNFNGNLTNNDRFGYSVANIGDLDNDGVVDLAVGAVYDGDGGYQFGAVYILFLNADGTVKAHQKISSEAGNFNVILPTLASFGSSITELGDLDGDNILDIAVGAYRDDSYVHNKTGALYILFLNSNGTVKTFEKISEGESGFNNTLASEDYFASSVENIGDLNKDGVVDLAVSAHRDDDGGTDKGAIYILFLNPDGSVKDTQKISATWGSFTASLDYGDFFGGEIASAGLHDSNDLTEIIVSSTKDDDGGLDKGAIYRLLVNTSGVVDSYEKVSELHNDINLKLDDGDGFGNSITFTDDLNLDGKPDLIVGATKDDDGGTNRGALYMLFAICQTLDTNAGVDQQLCDIYSTQLHANDPASGQGEWSVMLGDGILADKNDPKSMIQNLSVGRNTLVWTITNKTCTSRDTVSLDVISAPERADAGEDQIICGDVTYLNANRPSLPNKGYWSILEGNGIVENPDNPNSAVSNLSAGKNVFTWRVSNRCGNTHDTVAIISYKQPVKPDAGADFVLCDSRKTTLSVISPEYGQGKWMIVAGSGKIKKANSRVTEVDELSYGRNVFVWKVSNGICLPASDTVTVSVMRPLSYEDIPNAFSPNNDNINDFWRIKDIQLYPDNYLNVYNRWGKLVYEKEEYMNQWNGGKLPAGTYYYTLNLNQCNLEYKGRIQILH